MAWPLLTFLPASGVEASTVPLALFEETCLIDPRVSPSSAKSLRDQS